MKIKILFTVLLGILLLIESTVISYPLVFVVSLFAMLVLKSTRITVIVFAATVILDSLRVVPIGITSLFVLGFGLVALFYSRSLHAADILLFSVIIFCLSLLYSYIAHYPINLVWSVIVFGAIWIVLYKMYDKKGVITERNSSLL